MTVEQIDIDLRNTYSKLESHRFVSPIEWDSIVEENLIFNDKIEQYTSIYPQTLTYKFDYLRGSGIRIVSSEDKLFRIYSWDTWSGGTMHYFNNIFQYRHGENTYSKLNDSSNDVLNRFYSQIFSLTANDKTYYLAIGNGIQSGRDASQSIQIFTIDNRVLNDSIKLIKTKSGFVNSIDLRFDFFSVVDRPERPLRLIKYDSEEKIIYIPIVNEDRTVTDRFILYQFTGQYFEQVKTQKRKTKEE